MNEEVREIIQDLVEKSEQGGVNWIHASRNNWLNALPEPIEESAKDFSFSTPDFTINVFESRGVSGDPIARVNIHNSRGDVVAHAEDEPGTRDNALLSRLLEAAAEQVWGSRQTLEAIRRALKAGGPAISPPSDDDVPF